ncbi:hypothetical protein [Parapedobacter sp. 2B3]|uniref:hypothetical protein n=1 Tax=Parapedobacter sp. 2B3 TaxID=3342381 RepID=UPI0035B58028
MGKGKPENSNRAVQHLRIGSKLLELAIMLLLIAAAGFSLRAQQPDMLPVLQEQLANHQAAHPNSNLYLHLDKTTYTPEETVWFKAYLLGDTSLKAEVLYVRIVDGERNEVSSAQFPIYDIRAHGNIALSKPGKATRYVNGKYIVEPTLIDGHYMLYAYTDRMVAVGDTNVFAQPLRIGRVTGRRLEATASVIDTAMLYGGGQVQVKVNLTENSSFAEAVKGEYQLLAGGEELKYGRLTTNIFGEAFVNFTYPNLADHESLNVKLLFTKGNDYAELALNLPHRGNPVTVNCLPEGGRPVPGGRVAIEVLDIVGNPVQTSVRVMDGDSTVACVATGAQGMATVQLPHVAGVRYTVKTLDGRGQTTLDVPPAARLEGFSLKLSQDSTGSRAMVRNYGRDSTALLVLRTNSGILWSTQQEILPGDSVMVIVPVSKYPKDVLNLAVFDRDGTPQAERLFLNRADEPYRVTMTTDRQEYGTHQKVTVSIRATDASGNPVVANFSVAATDRNRNDSLVFRNILQQRYHNDFVPQVQYRLFSMEKKIDYDQVLLGRSWYGKRWESMPTYSPTSISNHFPVAGTTGIIASRNKKKIQEINIRSLKPANEVLLSLVGKNKRNDAREDKYKYVSVNVDADGTFFIPASQLHAFRDAPWVLDIYKGDSKENNYLVRWIDDDIGYDSLVASKPWLSPEVHVDVRGESPKIASAFSFNEINLLEEVVIGAREVTPRRLKADCKDMICELCNYLNCPARPAYRPTKGRIYDYSLNKVSGIDLASENKVIYLGCGRYRDINYIKNITIPEEFPLPDYGTYPTTELDMRSTVYWNPNVYTDADGTATFSFFTSDVTGEFEIVVQGLVESTLRPLMGTGGFNVVNR